MQITLSQSTTLQGAQNKYQIVKVLGQGTFGITYLARYKAEVKGMIGHGIAWTQVCIKEFFMKDLNSRDADGSVTEMSEASLVGRYRKSFIREAKNLSKMHHPGIVNIFEVFEANNTVYIVMEYIDGGNLDDYIRLKGRMAEDEALADFGQICSSIKYMHSQKMLHLDLKPKNVMRDEEGHLYLIDFGLSKQYNNNGEPESSTMIGLGTPGYAPIEQAKHQDNDTSFHATIDIYALGATLYKMLTGNTPPDATDVANSIIDGENIVMENLEDCGISKKISETVSKAMSPSSKKRIQSVDELQKLLYNSNSSPTNHHYNNCSKPHLSEGTLIDHPVKEQIIKKTQVSDSNKIDLNTEKSKNESIVDFGSVVTPKTETSPSIKQSSRRLQYIASFIILIFIVVFCVIKCAYSKNEPVESIISESNTSVSYINGILKVNDVTYEMIPIEGGTISMKGPKDNTYDVTLSNFLIGKFEVTQDLWMAVMGYNPSRFQGKHKPVEFLSWNGYKQFITKLNALTGENFRLPTEAEWEYAARGGNKSKNYKYSGSNDFNSVAWIRTNADSTTHDVGQLLPNELGLYDMSGNVSEFCEDWYDNHYYGLATVNPQGPSSGYWRVHRGGNWSHGDSECQTTTRNYCDPTTCNDNIGFRLALSEKSISDTLIRVDSTRSNQLTSKDVSYSNGELKIKGYTMKMVKVNGGTFTMGVTQKTQELKGVKEDIRISLQAINPIKEDEKPGHNVTLKSFRISEYEVTQKLWTMVMNSNPSKTIGSNLPVENVSWNDCQLFIERINMLTGKVFRLPTEAEWEYAARGGHKYQQTSYSGSNIIDDIAWYRKNSYNPLYEVGQKKPNSLKLFDMTGNVFEWCQDWYGKYDSIPANNPIGPSLGEFRVIRGGSIKTEEKDCRVSSRANANPDAHRDDLGFRIVLSE